MAPSFASSTAMQMTTATRDAPLSEYRPTSNYMISVLIFETLATSVYVKAKDLTQSHAVNQHNLGSKIHWRTCSTLSRPGEIACRSVASDFYQFFELNLNVWFCVPFALSNHENYTIPHP